MSKLLRMFFIVSSSILPLITTAQVWVACYNGPANDWDCAETIVIDESGAIYVTGTSIGLGTGYDYATVKYNSAGVEQWVAWYNGPPGNTVDEARAIAINNMGGVYVTGSSIGSGTERDYATVMYDSAGIEQWVTRYNGTGGGDDYANAIVVDNECNVYVTGRSDGSGTDRDYATVMYDSDGVEQWVARYTGSGVQRDEAMAIVVDDEGATYVTGRSTGLDTDYDYVTVKYDSMGVEQWSVRYDGPDSGVDQAYAIAIDDECNIYVTGESHGLGTGYDFATVKYTATGVEQWVARYNGSYNYFDAAYAIALDGTGAVYVTGYCTGVGTESDYATVKYDSAGIEQWVACYNGPVNKDDYARAIAIDDEDNVCVTGQSWGSGNGYDYATVKYDPTGAELWAIRYDGVGGGDDYAYGIAVDDLSNVYVTGGIMISGFNYDYATIKYLPTGIEEYRTNQIMSRDIGSTIFSGPLQLPEDKKCRVFDVMGRFVEPNTIKPGIYFIEVDGLVIQKVVKVR